MGRRCCRAGRRAAVYAAVAIGVVLVYIPARLLYWSGATSPPSIGVLQIGGALIAAASGALALWCVAAFAMAGKGTPAPFDPPRQLVVRGPYRWVRNPMYLAAVLALGGAALFYSSAALAAYAAGFLLLAHTVVAWFEEPTLRRRFGADYAAYCGTVRRWRPRFGAARQRWEADGAAGIAPGSGTGDRQDRAR